MCSEDNFDIKCSWRVAGPEKRYIKTVIIILIAIGESKSASKGQKLLVVACSRWLFDKKKVLRFRHFCFVLKDIVLVVYWLLCH